MKNSKVAVVLRTFSKEEFKEFGKFVSSPFFRKGRELSPLIKALKKYYPSFSQRTFTKENIYKKLHTGVYNDKLMRTLMSDLLNMCEEYLMQLTMRGNKSMMHSLFAVDMSSRKLDFLALKNIEAAERYRNEKIIDSDYFKKLSYIQDSRVAYGLVNDHQKDVCEFIKKRAEYNVYGFFSSISKSLHDMDANKVTFNIEYKDHIILKLLNNLNIENFLNQLVDEKYKDIIEIYLLVIYSRLNKKDEIYFKRLKKSLLNNFDKFDQHEQNYLINMFQSLCILKSVTVNREIYFRELFESFKIYLSRRLYKVSTAYIPVLVFLGILRTGMQLKEYEWIEKFVQIHIKDVSPEYRKNIQMLCNAQINFAKKEFDKSLKEVSKINLTLFPMKFDVTLLQLQLYYEKNYITEALNFLDSDIHFIKKNKKVSDIFKDRRRNFLNYYKKLLLYKNDESKTDITVLRNEISENEYITGKSWLLEKVEELS